MIYPYQKHMFWPLELVKPLFFIIAYSSWFPTPALFFRWWEGLEEKSKDRKGQPFFPWHFQREAYLCLYSSWSKQLFCSWSSWRSVDFFSSAGRKHEAFEMMGAVMELKYWVKKYGRSWEIIHYNFFWLELLIIIFKCALVNLYIFQILIQTF